MTRPMIRIHDLETDEVVDREMNDVEFAEYETIQAAIVLAKIDEETKTTEKNALLSRLGVTSDEAKLLLT